MAEKKYIELEEVRDVLADEFGLTNDQEERIIGRINHRAKSITAADVRPVVRGKWGADKSGYPMIVCSECGVKIPVIAGWCMDAHINFCPNCGADMRPEQP